MHVGRARKSRVRRGARKAKIQSLAIYSVNINGFMSKMDSLSSIIENIQPDIVALNELKVRNSGKIKTFFKEKGYELLIRTNGGIAIASLNKFKIVNVTTSKNPNMLAGLISDLNIRIVAGYGPQENVAKEDRKEFFNELSTEIQKAKNAGNSPIIIGDLNSKIESIGGGISALSSNGELLAEVVNNHELEVMNFNPKCTGYWTRVQTVNNEEVRSVLDYCIINSALASKVESMLIDE